MMAAQLDAASRQPKRRKRTPLRTAVIAALLHQAGHGYDIAARLKARMGPVWDVDLKSVYRVLVELEEDGLAWSERAPGRGAQLRRVFHPTARTEQERISEMGARRPVMLTRGDIRAWVAFARPQDASELIRKFDEYELDCLELLERAAELAEEPVSWHYRGINLLRMATTEELEAELRWIPRARREVREYLAR
jgi:DNA-binding PadR family transcriptional regulator